MRNTVYLPAAIGLLIGGTASVLQAGWTQMFIGAAVCAALLAALLLIRALWLANRKAAQIFDDELDDPDPYGMQVRHNPADTDTTGETR